MDELDGSVLMGATLDGAHAGSEASVAVKGARDDGDEEAPTGTAGEDNAGNPVEVAGAGISPEPVADGGS